MYIYVYIYIYICTFITILIYQNILLVANKAIKVTLLLSLLGVNSYPLVVHCNCFKKTLAGIAHELAHGLCISPWADHVFVCMQAGHCQNELLRAEHLNEMQLNYNTQENISPGRPRGLGQPGPARSRPGAHPGPPAAHPGPSRAPLDPGTTRIRSPYIHIFV